MNEIFVRDPLNEYVLGFYEVLIKSKDFCEILIFVCHAKKKKKRSRRKQEIESCALALIPEVEEHLGIQWETSNDYIICLITFDYLIFFFNTLTKDLYSFPLYLSSDFILQFFGFSTFQFLLPGTCNSMLLNIFQNLSFYLQVFCFLE